MARLWQDNARQELDHVRLGPGDAGEAGSQLRPVRGEQPLNRDHALILDRGHQVTVGCDDGIGARPGQPADRRSIRSQAGHEVQVDRDELAAFVRATYQVAALPRAALIEIEGVLVLPAAD